MANNREISQFAGLVTVNDTNNQVSIASTLELSGGGKLGIGTDNPAVKLAVATSVDGEATLATFKNTSQGGTNETVDIKLGLEGPTHTSNVVLRAGKGANHNSGAATDNFFAIHTTLNNASSEKLRVTSSGNVGINSASPTELLDVNGTIQTNAVLNSYLTTDRRNLILQRLDGITAGQTNGILFQQEYTTGSGNSRRLGFFGIERSNSTSGDQQSNFVMELCPDNSTNVGSGSPTADTTALRFDNNGRVQILKTNGGLYFNNGTSGNGTATSKVLDDYEEGTFTPKIRGSGTAGSVTYTSREGYYTKVGNKVTVWGFMDINTASGSTNTPWMTGWPFAPSTSLNNQNVIGTVTSSGGISNSGYLRYGTSAGPYVYRQTDSGTAIVPIGIIGSGNYITFTATYFV